MALDLFAVGPPARGLLRIGGRAQVHEKKGDTEKAAPSRPGTGKDRAPVRESTVNPYVEALKTWEEMQKARQVLSAFKPAPARKGLGAHVDLKA